VLRKRTYLCVEMCEDVLARPLRRQVQDDGRVHFWGKVFLPGEARARILRVVTLEDGTTIHNAFLDRGYREDQG
jgi:hypothetical protein